MPYCAKLHYRPIFVVVAPEKQRSSNGYNLPLYPPTKERDENYYRDYILALLHQHCTAGHYAQLRASDLYQSFLGKEANTEYHSQLEVYDIDPSQTPGGTGMNVPYIWVNMGEIQAKVKVLESDLIRRGFRPQVKVINKDAQERKSEAKQKALAAAIFRPYGRALDEALGEGPLAEPVDSPKNAADVEEYIRRTYKDQAGVVMQAVINYAIEYYRYKELRLQLFMDVAIVGECHAGVVIKNGMPEFQYCSPLRSVSDAFSMDDHRTDAQMFITWDYMTLPEIAEEFGIKSEEFEELQKLREKNKLSWNGVPSASDSIMFQPFQEHGEVQRALVARAQWLDVKEVAAKITTDQHGNEHFHTFYDDPKKAEKGDKLEKRLVRTTREAVLIGGHILRNWGEAKNQDRSVDDPTETNLDFLSLKPYTFLGQNQSAVGILTPLYRLRHFFWTKIQLEVSKSGGKGITIHPDRLPDEWGDSTTAVPLALYYLKGTGIQIANGEMGPDDRRAVEEFDMSIGNSIEAFLRLSEAIDQEAGVAVGVPDTRQGEVVSANQLSGVTAQTNAAAAAVTAGLHERFSHFESRLLTRFCAKAKICWAMNPEKFRPALGDFNFEWLLDNVDVDLQDYGMVIYREPIDFDTLQIYVNSAVSAGMPPHVGLKIMLIAVEDVSRAIQEFYREEESRQERAEQLQLQMAREANQAMLQAKQEDLKSKVAPAQIAADAKVQGAQIAGQAAANVARIKSGDQDRANIAKQATEIFKSRAQQALEDAKMAREPENQQNP